MFPGGSLCLSQHVAGGAMTTEVGAGGVVVVVVVAVVVEVAVVVLVAVVVVVAVAVVGAVVGGEPAICFFSKHTLPA